MNKLLKDIAIFLFILLSTALLISMCRNIHLIKESPTEIKYDTIYSIVHDTIYIKDTIPLYNTKLIEITKFDTIINNVPIELNEEHWVYNNTFNEDNTDVNVKIDYSGIRPRLNDVELNITRYDSIQYINTTITKYKQKHFNYGIVGGLGYGLINKKTDIWVGFGISYNF